MLLLSKVEASESIRFFESRIKAIIISLCLSQKSHVKTSLGLQKYSKQYVLFALHGPDLGYTS